MGPRSLGGRHIGGRPQNIARMAVAVHSYERNGVIVWVCSLRRLKGLEAGQHLQSFLKGALPLGLHVQRNQLLRQQKLAGSQCKSLHVQTGAVRKGLLLAHHMYSGQKPPNPFQYLWLIQFWRTTTAPRAD